MKNIIAIEDKSLSKPYDKRYIIVDKETGEILDNAQGYGYKTPQKAHMAYAYKNRDKKKDKVKKETETAIENWIKTHKDFINLMDTVNFEIQKGSWGPQDKFDAKLVDKMLTEAGLKVDFTAGDLIKVWKKNLY